ncbi:lipoprotein-releasing ABC transporter permease subunit [uncultured Piscinibacter sp.]|uniref:lipoprotein-releasing ABC transporter permease subunit n=1 Tax=uncultured Piscinibacter sp. TaxID=1131835 RepID=UPI00261EE95C|nr:lipoprotein-releasing ABC transporter permease subunit [uncultured Piscinibacter sp.]
MKLRRELPYELQVGWRYLRAARGGDANGFISFIAAVAMLGIALGVAALIIVLSVMNGFSKEVRDRMLSVIAHVQLFDADGGALRDWRATAAIAKRHEGVSAVAPFVAAQALLGRGDELRPVLVRGIDPKAEAGVSELAKRLYGPVLSRLRPGGDQVVLGAELARALGAQAGQRVTLVLPDPSRPGGAPRLLPLSVAATFEAGHFEYDSGMALMLIADAQRLFGLAGPGGVQLRLSDRDRAGEVGAALARELGPGILVNDWTRTNRQWFESVQIQKRMLFLILALIVAVAAFNLVSMLVMTVTDKQSDIAILRTLGATPRSIMGIFVVQGAASGFIGTVAGLLLGLLVAVNVGSLVPAIERLLGTTLLPANVYLIDHMPSDPRLADIVPIVIVSLLLSFVATLYPSWRASCVQPAQALRHE